MKIWKKKKKKKNRRTINMGNPATRKFLRKLSILEEVTATVPPENEVVKQEENIVNESTENVEEKPVVKTSRKKKTVQSDLDVV